MHTLRIIHVRRNTLIYPLWNAWDLCIFLTSSVTRLYLEKESMYMGVAHEPFALSDIPMVMTWRMSDCAYWYWNFTEIAIPNWTKIQGPSPVQIDSAISCFVRYTHDTPNHSEQNYLSKNKDKIYNTIHGSKKGWTVSFTLVYFLAFSHYKGHRPCSSSHKAWLVFEFHLPDD